MLASGRMYLSRKQMLFHYFFSIATGLICLTLLVYLPEDYFILFPLIPMFILGALYTKRQHKSLRFRFKKIQMSDDQFVDYAEKLAEKEGWIREYAERGWRVYTTKFKWYNWGTLIYLVHTKDGILYTSICDLYNRPSTTSWGRNRRNKEAIERLD